MPVAEIAINRNWLCVVVGVFCWIGVGCRGCVRQWFEWWQAVFVLHVGHGGGVVLGCRFCRRMWLLVALLAEVSAVYLESSPPSDVRQRIRLCPG